MYFKGFQSRDSAAATENGDVGLAAATGDGGAANEVGPTRHYS